MTPLVLDLVARLERNPAALSARGRDGVQRRQRGDDHRQSAEHDHRHAVAHPLRHFAAALAPVAAVGLVLTVVLIALVYPRGILDARAACAASPRRPHCIAGWCSSRSSSRVAMVVALLRRRSRSRRSPSSAARSCLFTRQRQAGEGLLRDRLAAARHVRRPVHRRRRAEKALLTPRRDRRRRPSRSANMPDAVPADRGALQPREQRAGGARAEAVRRRARRSAARLAGGRDGLDARRQFHPRSARSPISSWRARPLARRRDRLLDYFKVGAPLTVLSILFGIFWL